MRRQQGGGSSTELSFDSFGEAVQKINALRVKRDYTIRLNASAEEAAVPQALTMPDARYVENLEIMGLKSAGAESADTESADAESADADADSESGPVELRYQSSIAMTSNLTLRDVKLVQMVKVGNSYVPANEQNAGNKFPDPVAVKTGAYSLEVKGTVILNTPLNVDGGKTGTLSLDGGQIYTDTNEQSKPEGLTKSLICGKLENLAVLNIGDGCSLTVQEYSKRSGNNRQYTAAALTAGKLNNKGEVTVGGGDLKNAAASVTITDAQLEGGTLTVRGRAAFTDVTFSDGSDASKKSEIAVDQDFTIDRLLQNKASRAYLYTRQKEANKEPYLYIRGKVALEGEGAAPIQVGVRPPLAAGNAASLVFLEKAPKASAQLLTVESAQAEMFVPCPENVKNAKPYQVGEANGYILTKSGKGIYVYYTSEIVAALYKGDAQETIPANLVNYYTSFQDAVNAINALRNSREVYTILLLQDVGKEDAPVTVTLPSYASEVVVMSQSASQQKWFRYQGQLTMMSNVTLRDVGFRQMAKVGGEWLPVNDARAKNELPDPVNVSTGAYSLKIRGTVEFNTPLNVNGGGRGTLSLDGGQIYTNTNRQRAPMGAKESRICGRLQSLAALEIGKDGSLTVQEYGTVYGKDVRYTAAALTVTALRNKGDVTVGGANASGSAAATVNVTDAQLDSGTLTVKGRAAFTNVTMSGRAEIEADQDFTINGRFLCSTSQAYLYTRQRKAGQAPYLSITGKVALRNEKTDQIHVGVRPPLTAAKENEESWASLTNAPNASAQLLTATSAAAEMFAPCQENVRVSAYKAGDPTGYILTKRGTGVYVYYAQEIVAALCKEDVRDGRSENLDILNYYTSFPDAVNAINALRDRQAGYTLLLLQDVGRQDAPVSVTLPYYASQVVVKSLGSEPKGIYYGNSLALQCNTVFANVKFCPMRGKIGAKLDFNTGANDLTLQNVSLGTTSGMAFGNLSGNASRTVTLDSKDIAFAGNVMNCGTLLLKEDASVNGALRVNALQMAGGVTLTTAGEASFVNVVNETGNNRIVYKRTARGETNLTVKGDVSGGGSALALCMDLSGSGKSEGDFTLAMDKTGLKTTLDAGKKLANMSRVPTSAIAFSWRFAQGEYQSVAQERLVKASQGLYAIPDGMKKDTAILIYEGNTARCLDYTQAVNEINQLSNAAGTYTISVGEIDDVNLTDGSRYSPLPLPANNKAASLTIDSRESNQSGKLTFTGSVASYCDLVLKKIILNPVKSATSADPADFDLAVGGSKVRLEGVATEVNSKWKDGDSESAGFFGALTGRKNGVEVEIVNSPLRFKKGISSIGKLTLERSGIITCAASSVKELALRGTASWDALGVTAVEKVDASNMESESYLAGKQAAWTLLPQFTVSGEVTAPVLWKVIAVNSKANQIEYVSDYKDVGLAVAPKAPADRFIAYPYRKSDNQTKTVKAAEEWVAHKDSRNCVRNGAKSEMAICISGGGMTAAYAKSFAEAVTVIDRAANREAEYVIQFTDKAPQSVTTGALTLPAYAKSVTIKGAASGDGRTILQYSGTLAPRCDVAFEQILLTEGSVRSGQFVPTYSVTLALGGNPYELKFGAESGTFRKDPQKEGEADLIFQYVNGARGRLVLEGRKAEAKQYVSLAQIKLTDGSSLSAASYLTVQDVEVSSNASATLESRGAMKLTNITGQGTLKLNAHFTAANPSKTQLTVAGNVEGTEVHILPYLYNSAEKSYHLMNAGEAEALKVQAGKTPDARQKLADIPKASTEKISVWHGNAPDKYDSDSRLYKYEGALYITKEEMAICLTGYAKSFDSASDSNPMIYEAYFLDWNQMVREIDRIADKTRHYEAILLRDLGVASASVAPLGTLSMPLQASKLRVTSPAVSGQKDDSSALPDGPYNLFFTGTSISLRCDTTFERVGMMAVKKGKDGYESTAYNLSAGGYQLTVADLNSGATLGGRKYESLLGTVSGSASGMYGFSKTTKGSALSKPAQKVSGFGNAVFQGVEGEPLEIRDGISNVANLSVQGTTLQCPNGDVRVTNLSLASGRIEAKNIFSAGMLTLSNGSAATAWASLKGNGVCQLNHITVVGSGNRLEAQQDRNGNSQLTVNGSVSAAPVSGRTDSGEEAVIRIGIRPYGESGDGYAALQNNISLLTAPKASASWFLPLYKEGENPGMGGWTEGYGVYKNNKIIRYGAGDQVEVRLHMGAAQTLFATFEEAVAEIDSRSLYKAGTKEYEDYRIELLKDVEIGNASKNGSYSALTLPSRAKEVEIFSSEQGQKRSISFAGGVTLRCNTTFKNIGLYPMKTVQKQGVPTTADYALGNYRLTMDHVQTRWGDNTLVRNITGGASSGRLELNLPGQGGLSAASVSGLREVTLSGETSLTVSGNYNTHQICFNVEEGKTATLTVSGSLTAAQIKQTGKGGAVIKKPLAGAFSLTGAKTEQNKMAAVDRAEGCPKLQIQLMEGNHPAGAKVLTCPYLDTGDYLVSDEAEVRYHTWKDGNFLMLGSADTSERLNGFDKELWYSMPAQDLVYTGSAIEPEVTLWDGETALQKGTHYTLSYKDNTDAGEALITVQGVEANGYKGTGRIPFTIRKKSLSSTDIRIGFSGGIETAAVDGKEGCAVPGVQIVDAGKPAGNQTLTGYGKSKSGAESGEYQAFYGVNAEGNLRVTVEAANRNYKGRAELGFVRLSPDKPAFTVESCRVDKSGATIEMTASGSAETVSDSIEAASGGPYIMQMGEGLPSLGANQQKAKDGKLTATRPSGNMMGKYGLAVIEKNGYRIVSSNTRYIENPEVTAVTTTDYYGFYEEKVDTKKGMQGKHPIATKELGIEATLENIHLNELIKTSQNVRREGAAAYVPYEYKGKTYYFHDMVKYRQTIYYLNGWGDGDNPSSPYGGWRKNVSLNLLLQWDPELQYLIHPAARAAGKSYYTLNMKEEKARETFEALFCYMSEKLGGSEWREKDPKCYRVCNWILGNEINCCLVWNYSGSMSTVDCVNNYAEGFQMLYQAVKQNDKNARLFLSLDHDWTKGENGHKGKDYLDQFAKYMHETAPEMRWNVNYHPYSQPLWKNDFWNDFSNTTDNVNTPFISMRNIKVLTDYLGALEETYRMVNKDGTGRGYIRVILGEQGYIAAGPSQEASQAEAIRRQYEIVNENIRIDACINRAYNDDPEEGIMTLGIMYRNDKKKQAYEAYKNLPRPVWPEPPAPPTQQEASNP